MNDDLIKRSDVIEALYKYSFVSKDVIEKEINAIPSADRPQGWISCSERMPEEDTPVLVAIKTKDRLPKWVEEQTYHYVTDIDVWDSDDGWYQHRAKIVAWMPLPKPWKGADDDTSVRP